MRKIISSAGSELGIACAISGFWVSYYGYSYNTPILNSPFINWYAFVLWSLGLTGTIKVYKLLSSRLGSLRNIMLFTWLVYFGCLLAIEYFGYNILKIRLATNEPPLVFGLIHGSISLKIYYVAAGPFAVVIYKLKERIFKAARLKDCG